MRFDKFNSLWGKLLSFLSRVQYFSIPTFDGNTQFLGFSFNCVSTCLSFSLNLSSPTSPTRYCHMIKCVGGTFIIIRSTRSSRSGPKYGITPGAHCNKNGNVTLESHDERSDMLKLNDFTVPDVLG